MRTGHTAAMDAPYVGDELLETSDLMVQEGRRIVDFARGRGVVLRLLGGLAVREHCAGARACRREHMDLDFAGLRKQTEGVIEVFGELGYAERVHVRVATGMGQAQFIRDCVHVDGDGGRRHADDHVDVFFDRFKLDHVIDLRSRLALHAYAIPLTDTLATKLQMHDPEPRDVLDVLMLLATARAEDSTADAIDTAYLGKLCAHDWGMFHDVALNLQRCGERLADAELSETERDRAAALLARCIGAIDSAPKTLAWRLRARVGTRRRWWDIVEEQGGTSS